MGSKPASDPEHSVASRPSGVAQLHDFGARGAFASGALTAALVLLVGASASITFYYFARDVDNTREILGRFVRLAIAAGGAAILTRLVCRPRTRKLFTTRWSLGDMAAGVAVLLGLIVAGYVTQQYFLVDEPAPTGVDIGKPVALVGPTHEGGRFDLAEHRGKVVLVDFWASWCGPCIAELPNVRAVYDKYREHGFEVVAVSLDFEREDLTKYLQAHPEPWPQLFFADKKDQGFDNPLAKQFGIRAIPHLMLVDRDGNLAARGVRGAQIEVATAKALGLPPPAISGTKAWLAQLMHWMFIGLLASPTRVLAPTVWGLTLILALAEKRLFRPRTSNAASPVGA